MSITMYDNLTEMLKKPLDFEILKHLDVDEVDDLVKRNIILILVKNKCDENIMLDSFISYMTEAMYDVKLVYDLTELFKLMNKHISGISYIYSFHPVINMSWVMKKTPLEFNMVLKSLKDFKIGIYPNNKMSYFVNSLIYHKMMEDHYPEFGIPRSHTVFYPSWNNQFCDEYVEKIMAHLKELEKDGNKGATLLKGFSNGNAGTRHIKLSATDAEKKKMIKSLDYTNDTVDNNFVKNGEYDKGGFKAVVVQPYHKETPGSVHSLFFVEGELLDMYYTNEKKIITHYDNEFLNRLKDFGTRCINTFVKEFAKKIPDFVRLDVGTLINKKLCDKYSVKIQNNKVTIRFYVKNLSINPFVLFDCVNENDELNLLIDEYKEKLYKSVFMGMYKHSQNTRALNIIKKIN
jgi:hypothetical protein